MENKNTDVQTKQSKSRKFGLVKWIAVGLVGIVLLIFFGTPLFLSSSGGKHLLLGRINQSVDGTVQMDNFSIGWFKGIKLTNLSYDDNAGQTSVKVRRIETQPQYVSLLGGKVKLGKTVIDTPQVYLKVPQEKEKPATVGVSKTETKPSEASAFPIDQINLEVIDGSATIELAGAVPQTIRFANIGSKVEIAEAGKPSSLDISMDVNEASKISAKGTATPAPKGWMLKEGDFEVQISKLKLAELKPLFALAGQDMDMAGELNANATVEIKDNQVQQLKADAVITDFAQGKGDQRTVFEQPVKLSALVTGDGKTMKIENAMVQSAFCTVNCSGSMDKLNYAIAADLAQTFRFAGQFADMQGLAIEGNLSMQGAVNFAEDRIGVSGIGNIKQLIAKKNALQTPVTDVQMDFDCAVNKTANQFQLASANLTAAPGTVKIVNLVLPMGIEASKTISVDAQAKLDLAKTWAFAQVFAELPKNVQLAGMLDSAITATTSGSSVHLQTEKTQINKLRIMQEGSEPFEREQVGLKGDVIWRSEPEMEEIEISMNMLDENGNALLKINKALFERKKSQNNTKVQGDLKAEYDLKALSTIASPFMPAGLVMEGKRSDVLTFDSQYPTDQPERMMQNLNAAGTVGFAKASYQGLNFGPTEMKLNVKQGQAAIDIPDADVNGGKVRFAGDINLAEKPMMLRLRKSPQVANVKVVENVKIDDVISAKLLQYLNPVFAKGTGVTGTANLSCSTLAIPLGGESPKDINLIGSIGLTDVRLSSPLLGLISVAMRTEGLNLFSIPVSDFTVKDGLVRYEDMPMIFGSNFTLHFGGTVGLDKSLAMNIQVPIKEKTYPVALGGTLDRPKPDFAKLLLSNITEQIPIKDEKTKEAVEKGLELFEGIFNKPQKK